MKPWLLLLAICFCGLAYAQSPLDKISPALLERFDANPDQSESVIIVMADYADISVLMESFRLNKTNQKARIAQLYPLLQEKARNTQSGLISYLTESRSMDPEDIRSFWIANIIQIEAKKSLVLNIAGRADVASVIYNAPLELEEYECNEATAAIAAPNGTESGLRAINANEMWSLGYTGYGALAFGADTGIQPFHPAYINRWRGLYAERSASWYEYSTNNTIPFACGDHGGHTLGTMVGLDRVTKDTIGVAMNANWIGGPIITCNNNGTADNIGAFEWALNPDGDINTTDDMPTVINNSWRDPQVSDNQCNSVYLQTLQVCEAAGVAIVFSAGNSGPDVSSITPPKNINVTEINSFCVGNLDGNSSSLGITNSSSRGPSICGGTESILIKPEVSAPGTNVRSSEFDRTYGNKTGTSMAAPHVAGAMLLLKEAFPDLLSEDFKWALYLSARDLGDPGEDNDYGNGIIDVRAAYEYLINQGNIPTPPRSTNLDLIGADTDEQVEYCSTESLASFFIMNGGQDEIQTFEYEVIAERYSGVVEWSDNGTWTGNLSAQQITEIKIDLTSIPEGEYLIKFNTSLPNGQEDPRPLNNALGKLVSLNNIGSVAVNIHGSQTATSCENSTVTLTGEVITTSNSDYFFRWYEDFQNTDLVAEGKTFTFDLGTTEEVYYAKPFLQDIGGEDVPNEGGNLTSGKELFFTVLAPTVLRSVEVYAEEEGNRFLNIKTLDGVNTIITRTINVVAPGKTEVTIDKLLDPGSYRMNYIVPKPLLEINSDLDYPYMVGNTIRINGASEEDVYPYFFNWKTERDFDCAAQKITVTPEGISDMNLAFEVANDFFYIDDQITVTNTSTGVERYDWLVDGLLTFEDTESPVFSFSETGNYTITMVGTNAAGCQTSLSTVVDIDAISSIDFPIEQYQFRMFPNPTSEKVFVEIGLPANQNARFSLIDNLGRRMPVTIPEARGSQSFNLDVSTLMTGLYFLEIRIEGKPAWVHKLIVK